MPIVIPGPWLWEHLKNPFGKPPPGVIFERTHGQIGNPWWGGSDVGPELNPDPVPWSVAFLISAASSKAAAASMSNKAAAQQFIAAADQAIASFIDSDDICPRWPFPGPPPWLSVIASELTLVANTLQEGNLRTGILNVAGKVLDRVALNPQPLPP
jgi:hypothetical protein